MPNEVEIKITADDLTGPGFAAVLAKLALLKRMAKDIGGSIGPDMDVGKMTSSLLLLKQKMQSLGIADIADVNQTPGAITSRLLLIKRLVDQAKISDLLGFDVSNSDIAAQLEKIKGMAAVIPVNWDVSALPVVGPTSSTNRTIPIIVNQQQQQGVPWLSAQLAILAARATATRGPITALIGNAGGSGSGGGGAGLLGLGAAAGYMGRGFRLAGMQIGAFGLSVALWHVVLDGIIEGAIITVGSLAAIGAAAEALGGAAENLYDQLKGVFVVNEALGTKIPPLTDRFVQLQKALAPQGVEIYGAALNAINSQSGALSKALVPVVNMLDDFAARFDIWIKDFGSTGKIFTSGIGFLTQIGDIFGALGQGIGNLVKAEPGVAHFLLDLILWTADLFDVITKIPAPLLEFALALHGAYVWGSVLAAGLSRLIGFFAKLYTTLAGFATNPLAWVVVGAAALAYMGWQATQADSSTKAFINNLNAGLTELSGSSAFQQTISDIAQLQAKINSINVTSVANSMSYFHSAVLDVGFGVDSVVKGLSDLVSFNVTGYFTNLGHFLMTLAGNENAAYGQQVQNDIHAYDAEINKLVGDQTGMLQTLGGVTKMGFSVAQSWALMTLAGVKAGDSFQLAMVKVQNLLEGYQELNIKGGLLANSVNAVTFASLQQSSQVSSLNSDWTNFLNVVTGGISAIATFGSDMGTLSTDTAAVKGDLNGVSAAALTARGQFVTTASGASTLLENLTLMASAAQGSASVVGDLSDAGKDLVAILLPAARGSNQLQSALWALAEQGGYQGADSLQDLAKWADISKDPMSSLNGIVTTLTKSAANLTGDVKSLSDALGVTLNSAMASAIFYASGGQKVFNAFATAILAAHGQTVQVTPAIAGMARELLTVTGSATTAKNEFIVFSEGLGLTQKQADVLWQATLPSLQNQINSLHGKAIPITADTAQAQGAINGIIALLEHVNGMTATTYINTVTSTASMPGGRIAHGASGGYHSGLTVVGEEGWELVNLPPGSYVTPHNKSVAALSGGAGGGSVGVNVTLSLGKGMPPGLGAELLKAIRYEVRTKGGGSAQNALGSGGD